MGRRLVPSEEPGSRRALSSGPRRAIGWFLLAGAGCGLAAWVLWSAWSGRAADRPASAPELVQNPPPELDPPVAAGMVNVRMRVRSFDRSGNEDVIGKTLRKKAILKLTGAEGQPYEAQFDRVGMWSVEIPPGEYSVSRKQPSLEQWEWSLSGREVTEGIDGYRVSLRLGQAPTLELALR